MTPPPEALAGIRLVDLTRVRAGPTCVKQFADWGADVIKVELPGEAEDSGFGPRGGSDFQNLHRNKRSLTLNLKDPRGVEILKRLAATADVVVENFRPDVKHRLGIGYQELSAANPRLVYASISGFGEDGPYRERPGFDQIAQGMGGLMAVTGLPGQGPVRAGIPVADLAAGLFCAIGILLALLERNRSGRGQWVQTNLLAAMVAMMDFQAARYLVEGEVPGQAGNDHPTSIPTGVFPSADGHINIGASGQAIFRRLCETLGMAQLAALPEYATAPARSANRAALNAAIADRTRSHRTADLIELLNRAGVPCGPIYRMDEVFADPQVRHFGMAVNVPRAAGGELSLVGPALKLSRTPARMKRAIGAAGEHSAEILRELGYSEAAVAELRAQKVL